MIIILIIGFVVLFFMHLALVDRVKKLEAQLKGHAASQPNPKTSATTPRALTVPPTIPTGPVGAPPPVAARSTPLTMEEIMREPDQPHEHTQTVTPPSSGPNPFFLWMKEHTLIKIGAFLFFIGAVWFVSYAISQGWISPEMRIAFGLLTGVGVYVLGYWRQRFSVTEYVTLTTLGTGIVIASFYAGQFLFDLFHPLIALSGILLSIGYTVYVSLLTNKEWLACSAAGAALIAPLLVHSPDSTAGLFFSYLLVVSVGFLTVVFFTRWRSITLLLAIATFLYHLIYLGNDAITPAQTWLFATSFTILFLGACGIALLRETKPTPLIITTSLFSSITLLLLLLTSETYETITTFGLALLTGLYTIALYQERKDVQISMLPAALTGIFVLAGTAFWFDSFALSMAYTIEVTAAIALALYFQAPKRILTVTFLSFALPTLVTLPLILGTSWDVSLTHPDVLASVVYVIACIFITTLSIHRLLITNDQWYVAAASWFGSLSYIFGLIVSWQLISNLGVSEAAMRVTFVLISFGWSSVFLWLASRVRELASWLPASVTTLVVPFVASLVLLSTESWQFGIAHLDALGAYLFSGAFLWIGVSLYRQRQKNTAGGILIAHYIHSVILLAVSAAALTNNQAELATTYTLWTVLSLAYFAGLLALRAPVSWVTTAVASLGLPILFTLPSMVAEGWAGSILHPDAFGLYFMTIVCGSMAYVLTLIARRPQPYQSLRAWVPYLTGASVGYAVILVWLLTHALFTTDDSAITIALLIYTISGLSAYVYGSNHQTIFIKTIGVILLGGVIARVLLVEVWRLDPFWQIVTFLGMGALFIAAAFIEKPFQTKTPEQATEPLQ